MKNEILVIVKTKSHICPIFAYFITKINTDKWRLNEVSLRICMRFTKYIIYTADHKICNLFQNQAIENWLLKLVPTYEKIIKEIYFLISILLDSYIKSVAFQNRCRIISDKSNSLKKSLKKYVPNIIYTVEPP